MQILLLDDAVLEVPAQTFVNLLKDRPVRKTLPRIILQGWNLSSSKSAQGGIVRPSEVSSFNVSFSRRAAAYPHA